MFFCDTPTRRIFTFRYSPEGGLGERKLLWEMPSDMEGGPDGAQCDAQGYLWATLSGASQVSTKGIQPQCFFLFSFRLTVIPGPHLFSLAVQLLDPFPCLVEFIKDIQ